MSRIWLLRGGVVAVIAFLVGAWALGLAELSDSAPSREKVTSPESPEESPAYDIRNAIVVEKARQRRTRDADPTQEPGTEPSTDAAEPTDDAPSTPGEPSPDPTSPGPSPSDPPDSDGPTPTPSDPPSQPGDECTDPGGAVDCLLSPITSHP